MLKVVYSPVNAFKEIVKNPNIRGPLLIFLLFLLASAGYQYVSASKAIFEISVPEQDTWTESTALWTPEGVSVNGADRVVGNYSIVFAVSNDTQIWMKRTEIDSINCSTDEGCTGLSFRIKWTHQNNIFPTNAKLRLFSEDNSYFELDIDNKIANLSDAWYNVTVNTGPTNSDWQSSANSPNWENITGLEFELTWLASEAADLTLKIDDLYFGKLVPLLATERFTGWFIESLMTTAFSFFLGWSLYAVLLLLIIKLSGGEAGRWSVLFLVIGYTFSIRIVHVLVDAFLVSTLPPLVFPLKAWNPIPGEEGLANKLIDEIYQTNWYPTLAYSLTLPVVIVFYAWAIALSTIALHFLRDFTWRKAASISITAYLIYIFVRGFLGI